MTTVIFQTTRPLSGIKLTNTILFTAKLLYRLPQPSIRSSLQTMSFSSGSSLDRGHTDNDDPQRPLLASQGEDMRNKQNGRSKSKQSKQGKGQRPKSGDTHFLCFPLTTKAAIPQLVQSLNSFKDATTTVHPRQKLMEQRRLEAEAKSGPQNGRSIDLASDPTSSPTQTAQPISFIATESSRLQPLDSSFPTNPNSSIRIIPPAAHRPPGTFHLTLGTMDLSSPTEMRRAIDLLRSLNLQSMLALTSMPSQTEHSATQQPPHPTAPDPSTKRRLSKPNPTRLNDTSGATEMSDDLSRAGRLVKDVGHGIKEGVEKTVDTLRRSVSPPDSTSRRRSRGVSLSSPLNSPPLQAQDGAVIGDDVDSAHHQPTAMKRDAVPADKRLNGLESTTMQRQPPLTVDLHGLGTFPSAKKARVFYAPPQEQDASERLLPFANAIRQRFRNAGFVTEARPLTLHATVANLRYASKAQKGRGGRAARAWEKDTVDARSLIACFNGVEDGRTEQDREGAATAENLRPGDSFVFAKDIVIDRVRICKMGAETSEDAVLGMVYPAIRISGDEGEMDVVAEVVFGEETEEMAY